MGGFTGSAHQLLQIYRKVGLIIGKAGGNPRFWLQVVYDCQCRKINIRACDPYGKNTIGLCFFSPRIFLAETQIFHIVIIISK